MSSSSTSPQWEFDVFLSFRGKDLRDNIISHLDRRLKREGFSRFFDEDEEHAGKRIKDNIFQAIQDARVALILLSENYADSKWCLNELVEILNCRSNPWNLVVIPVFHGVDPADVKNLTSKSKFGQAFQRLHEAEKDDHQKGKWRKALKDLKKIAGLELKRCSNEADLLNKIVHSLHEKICPSQSLDSVKNTIGANRLAHDVIPLLRIGHRDVRMICISGTEGIGKTMVARAVCRGTLDKFDRFIFLDKVGEAKDSDLVSLQKKLLQNLIQRNGQMPDDSSHGYTEKIKENLGNKKILLILDGVTTKEQIKPFGAENRKSFCRGSTILITTIYRDLLKDLEVNDEYVVEGLNRDEAFRLFCRHAFNREEPQEGYEELSRYLAHYAGGHPLALEKWGSFLANRLNPNEWRVISNELANSPDHINSFIPDFERIFTEYPCKVVGPRGGDQSTDAWKDEEYTGVRKIEAGVDSAGIKFITIVYDNGGRECNSVTRGTKGSRTSTIPIELDYPREYLTYMSGCTKKDSGRTILRSLTFHTNIGKRKSIGTDEEGGKLSFPYTGHQIIGFRGSCSSSHLESIEAIYKRIPHTPIGFDGRIFGPFGGAGEKSWDSGDINGIFISYSEFISEINFEVHKATSFKPRTTYGENGGENTFQVQLETLHEWITSFSGYFENAHNGRIIIKSLTFRTNKRILGPIGREEGKHFSSPSPSDAVKVTRFFGRTVDNYLESIGAEVKQYHPFQSVGLFGCSDVLNWDDRNGDYTNVSEITVEFAPRNRFIRSITFRYEPKDGMQSETKRHPDNPTEGVERCMIKIYPYEYLTSMSGYYTEHGITSLTFGTNKRTLELIGHEEGTHFSSPMAVGKIVGFYGRSGEHLEAIGAYFEPHLDSIKSIGPFGVLGECAWDHRKFKGVRKIEVEHDNNIHCIKFVYDHNGCDQSYLVKDDGHTKRDHPKVTPVILDYPREYLTSISGYARKDGVIQSLTFYSNKRRYGPYGKETGHGPYGKETGKYFWYPSNGSRIIGFYGTRGTDNGPLKSIGVHVEPIPRMYPFKTVGPFGGAGGTPWDDGVHTDVRGFHISFGKAIKAIRIAYDNNGSLVLGSEHGTRGNDKYKELMLDYPKERLLSISVWVDKDRKTGQPIIRDLKIFTTKTYYGKFILESQKQDKPTQFFIPSEEDSGRRIVGFFGRVGRYLHSIGARLEPYSN